MEVCAFSGGLAIIPEGAPVVCKRTIKELEVRTAAGRGVWMQVRNLIREEAGLVVEREDIVGVL